MNQFFELAITPVQLLEAVLPWPQIQLNYTQKQCFQIEEFFEPTILENLIIRIIFAILYVSIWLMGIIGNGSVLAVVAVSSYMRYRYGNSERIGRTNPAFPVRSIFVVSLACSDLLITLTSLPITAVTIFSQIWIFPTFMCYCIGFFQALSIFQSSFTFTTIALDRCLLITRPKRPVVNYRLARIIVISTALLALCLASPMAFLMNMETVETDGLSVCGQFCVEHWPWWRGRSYYGMSVILLQLALPAVVTAVCYTVIGVALKKRSRYRFRRGSTAAPSVTNACRMDERRKRTNRMMACMVTAFVLLWTPFNLLNLLRDLNLSYDLFQRNQSGGVNFRSLHALAHILAMMSVVWNPIMYAWWNESIRNLLRPVLTFLGQRMSQETIRRTNKGRRVGRNV